MGRKEEGRKEEERKEEDGRGGRREGKKRGGKLGLGERTGTRGERIEEEGENYHKKISLDHFFPSQFSEQSKVFSF